MPKIIFEKSKCVGCGSCTALCSKYWELGEDGKIHLKNSNANLENGNEELEIEELDCNQDAADACAGQCIKIEK